MPTFEIEQYELHAMKYRVEAASEADAIRLLLDGEAEPVEQSQDFIEVAEDFGIPVEQNRELADELRALGVPIGEAVIPSIRNIVKVK
jgi:type III secretion system FlhB-like substrate exporter